MSQSSYISSQKKSLSRNKFYKHGNIQKLNYYSRFSPNRKKLDKQFELDILEGASPLSPRSYTSSNSSKTMKKSFYKKVFKDQHSKNKNQQFQQNRQENQFQLIGENQLLKINSINAKHGEIYIDQQEDQNHNLNNNYYHEQQQSSEKNNPSTNLNPHFTDNKSSNQQVSHQQPKLIPNLQHINNINNRSQTNQQSSSSFQKMIQPSSSDDVEFYYNKPSNGGQMLICDDDQDQQQQNFYVDKIQQSRRGHSDLNSISKVCQDQNKNLVSIVYQGDDKILQLAKSIGAVKNDQQQFQSQKSSKTNSQIHIRQTHSQHVSFSIDSDLSIIQQKWNSYFDEENTIEQLKIEKKQLKTNLNSQKSPKTDRQNHTSYENKQKYQTRRKMSEQASSSSSGQLPSFSTPATSKYENSESLRSSHYQQQILDQNPIPIVNTHESGSEQTKQFKRQFTFGNQLVSRSGMFDNHDDQQEYAKKSQDNVPLFMKLLSKQKLQNFKQSKINNKQKNKSNSNSVKQKPNLNFQKKQKINNKSTQNRSILQKAAQLNLKSRNSQQQQKSTSIFISQPYKFKMNKQQRHAKNNQKRFNQVHSIKQSLNANILNFNDFASKKRYQKARKQQKWQQTLKSMMQRQKNKAQSQKKQQDQQRKSSKSKSSSKQKKKSQSQYNQKDQTQQQAHSTSQKLVSILKNNPIMIIDEQQQEPVVSLPNQKFQSPIKNIYHPYNQYQNDQQTTSYSKIYTQKREMKNRKGSYQQQYEKNRSFTDKNSSQEGERSQAENQLYENRDQEDYFSQNKITDRQSLTTATQNLQITNQYQSYTYYNNPNQNSKNSSPSPSHRQTYSRQIQNLKKYLQKINGTTYRQQNIQQMRTKQFNIGQDQWIGSLKVFQDKDGQIDGQKQGVKQLVYIQEQELEESEQIKNQLKNEEKSLKLSLKNNQLIKQNQKGLNAQKQERQYTQIFEQQYFICQNTTKTQPEVIFKSLQTLQKCMPSMPSQFMPVFQKLYTQIYQQQLKYHHKLLRQNFLLQFMKQLIGSTERKLDSQNFLSYQPNKIDNQNEIHGQYSNYKQNNNKQHNAIKENSIEFDQHQNTPKCELNTKQDQLQILINKHIIFGLVRKICQ